MKTCIKCGEEKDVTDFAYNGMSIDQLSDMCKVCKGGTVAHVAKAKPVEVVVPKAAETVVVNEVTPVPEVVVKAPANDAVAAAAPKRVVGEAAPVVEDKPAVDPTTAGVVAASEVTPIEPPHSGSK
jgi:hypothetical protein